MGGISSSFAEVGAVHGGHDISGLVADEFRKAVVLVGPVEAQDQYTAFSSDSEIIV